MNVVFRVDSSLVIGSGHLYRCLALAKQLVLLVERVIFICTDHDGNLVSLIDEAGFELKLLAPPEDDIDPSDSNTWLGRSYLNDAKLSQDAIAQLSDVELIIVDHYAIDYRWEELLAANNRRIMVIDDLANRKHSCDFLLDQTLGRNPSQYCELVSPYTELLLGTEYSLLREEFFWLKEQCQSERLASTGFNKILISLGGTDRLNVSEILLKLLHHSTLASDTEILVIIGPNNPHYHSLNLACSKARFNCELRQAISNMAEVLSQVDLVIGASGASAWERCLLGLPSICIELADNQKEICESLNRTGAAISLGTAKTIDSVRLNTALDKVQINYQEMVKRAFHLVDGRGGLRAAGCLYQQVLNNGALVHLKLASQYDCEQLYNWQTDPATRQYALNTNIPSWQEHQQWFRKRTVSYNHHLYIVHSLGASLGMIRLDPLEESNCYQVSIVTATKYKRLGVAKAALKLIRSAMPKTTFYATILANNTASQNLFIQQGYQSIGNNRYIQVAETTQ